MQYINTIKTFIIKNFKELFSYFIVGVCTTSINFVSYAFFAHAIDFSTVISTALAWLVATSFAFFANRRWVFHSRQKGVRLVAKECMLFFLCRITSGVTEVVGMHLMVDIMAINDFFSKIFMTGVATVINYLGSKLLVFRKKNK